MNFKEIYLPLNGKSDVINEDKLGLWYMLTGPTNNPALMFLNEEFKNKYGFIVLATINGYYPSGIFDKVEVKNKTDIYINDKPVLRIRGWGYLIGSLNLTTEESVVIQDEFVKYIVECLKTKTNVEN